MALPGINFQAVYFQQDGCPVGSCKVFFEKNFPRIMSNEGTIFYSARSPDLTPLEIFFWDT